MSTWVVVGVVDCGGLRACKRRRERRDVLPAKLLCRRWRMDVPYRGEYKDQYELLWSIR